MPPSPRGPSAEAAGRAHRARHHPRRAGPRSFQSGGARPAAQPGGRPAARRPVRPAGPPGRGPAADRLLDLGRAARLAGRARARGRAGGGHADRGGRGGGAARRRPGLADWSALHTDQQRVGLVHAAVQAGATLLFGGSLLARRAGRRGTAPRWRSADSPPPPSAAIWAATWRCGSGPDRATPSRSGTWPRSAGRTSARWRSCPRGGPPDASSGTSACSRSGRAGRLRPVRPVLAPRRPAAPGPSCDRPR